MSLALTEKQAREIETLCEIARENGAVVSLRELIGLAAIEASERDLAKAFHSDSKLRSKFLLEAGYVLERSPATEANARQAVQEEEGRRERARTNLTRAAMFGRALTKGNVVVAVSGGTSYLSSTEDEDIDFFCVTKTNNMWPFILRALILARIHRLANRDVPELCFSCVMDEDWASQEFRKRQDPIFARDALTAKVIAGGAAYHALLQDASWMKSYFPTFYEMRIRETAPKGPQKARETSPGSGRAVLNVLLYHAVGSFLRMKSWALNRKLTKAGWKSSLFTTRVGPRCYVYESNEYRKLRGMYRGME